MDFIDDIQTFAKNIPAISAKILTEEGTKNALVMPFIRMLGYDPFNPNEVNPEYIADVGVKKGEKIDYAIMKDDKPVILIECKAVNTDLNKEHASQLFRYFTVTNTPARVGILTNGIIYQFFTDLDERNKMDKKPFLEIDLLDIKEPMIIELKKFSKQQLNLDELESHATHLKYTREIIQKLNNEFSNPSEEFVKFFAQQVYLKKYTQQAKENFSKITKEALNQFLTDKINERLKSAMAPEASKTAQTSAEAGQQPIPEGVEKIVPTEDEWEAYYIIKAILHEVTDPSRVFMRDAKSYCAILLDDNNRKPICRLFFHTKQKYLTVFDNEQTEGDKIPIDGVDDLFKMGEHFKKVVAKYDKKQVADVKTTETADKKISPK
jgi:predicted type IV restriction endonuclease